MSRGKKAFITSLALLGLSVFLCVSPATAAMTVTSAAVGSSDDLAPSPVGEVTAALDLVTGNSVNVTWTLAIDDFGRQTAASSDFTSGGVFVNVNDVASYNVWRQVIGATEAVLIGSAGAGSTSFVDNTVVTGETYTYSVTVADAAGNESSAVQSAQVNLGPPPKSTPKRPAKTVVKKRVKLTFDAQLDFTDETAVADFRANFIARLAALLGIDPTQITIVGVSAGSVVVDFSISGASAEANADALLATVAADPSALADIGPVLSSSAFTEATLDMGDVGIGGQLVEIFDFTNDPDDPDAVLIIAAEVSGAGYSVDPATLNITAGLTDSIDVIFTAADVSDLTGTYAGVLTITTNDPNNRTTVIDLTAAISQGVNLPSISTSGAFNFASVAIGATRDLTLTISNNGDLELSGSLAVTGDAAFTVSDASFTVAGGSDLAVTVTFAPTAAQSYSGSIVISSNDAVQPEVTVALSGAGFDPGNIPRLVDEDGNPILGDFDGNATVNFDDFFIFADNFGQADFTAATDLDASGAVNFDDFFIFADNFGKSGTYVGGTTTTTGTNFSATIDATQAGTTSTGSGSGTVTLSADESTITYSATVTGLVDLTAAHFHNAAAGSTGGVVHTLAFTTTDDVTWMVSGSWTTSDAEETLTSALVDELKAGNLYINVHTTASPGGEIRGQVLAQ